MFAATLLTILPLFAGLAGTGDVTDTGPDSPTKVKSAKGVKAAKVDPFAEVTRLKRSATGKTPEEKHAALTAAAQECARVAKGAMEPAVVAEANWRAGEIWRTLRHEEEARRCFTATAGMSAVEPQLAAKAWLEIGHLDRRAKRFDAAIESYRRVFAITPEQRKESAHSLTWQGKALLAKDDAAGGHAMLLAVGQRYPEFAVDDIHNVDIVACDWIEAGRVDEARELVDDCRERHANLDGATTEDDDSDTDAVAAIERAFSKMKCIKLLDAPTAKS